MKKLHEDEGWKLVKRICSFWAIQEPMEEEIERDHYEGFLNENGQDIYQKALSWQGGTSLKERKRFAEQPSISRQVEYYLSHHDPDDWSPDLEPLIDMIFQVTLEIVKEFIDLDATRPVINPRKRLKQIEEFFYNCPNCGKENTSSFFHGVTTSCGYCKIKLDINKDQKK